jgi:hypothetical protein
MIKAIQTRYAGCHFRSRLEARWAVVFDVLKIKWEYEPQGFETEHGWYLPDFRLPEKDLWLEIKGEHPGWLNLARERSFTESLESGRCLVLIGDIPRPDSNVAELEYAWHPIPGRIEWASVFDGPLGGLDPFTDGMPNNIGWALTVGRSARFEHGEAPNAFGAYGYEATEIGPPKHMCNDPFCTGPHWGEKK